MKAKLEALLRQVGRDGIEDLIKFLNDSDFYIAPCSTKYHLAKEGGLVEHTLNVIEVAFEINHKYGALYPAESIIIAGAGHDLCKANYYSQPDPPTTAQKTFLDGLCQKARIPVPKKLSKTYASACIDHLKSGKPLPLPEMAPEFGVNDQEPLGHGEKSVMILQRFIKLTLDEMLAIRWHMASFDAGIHFPYPSGYAYNEALKKSKLVSILILADMEASFLKEA